MSEWVNYSISSLVALGGLITDTTTPKNKDGVYPLFYLAINVGFTISPIIGGLLLENYLWLLFVFDGFITVLRNT